MKLFKTKNGLHMIECHPYNWLINDSYGWTNELEMDWEKDLIFTIDIGGLDDMKNITYYPLKNVMKISGGISIKVDTFQEASTLVHKMIIGLEITRNGDWNRKEQYKNYYDLTRTIYKYTPEQYDYCKVHKKFQDKFDEMYRKYVINLRSKKLERIIK
jgi:hypothetical protein